MDQYGHCMPYPDSTCFENQLLAAGLQIHVLIWLIVFGRSFYEFRIMHASSTTTIRRIEGKTLWYVHLETDLQIKKSITCFVLGLARERFDGNSIWYHASFILQSFVFFQGFTFRLCAGAVRFYQSVLGFMIQNTFYLTNKIPKFIN